ncbi:archease, partial [Gregarina niphandrodes]
WRRSEGSGTGAGFVGLNVSRNTEVPVVATVAGKVPHHPKNYSYEDHPADVRIRATGKFDECLVGLCKGVYAYMTDVSRVEPKEVMTVDIPKSENLSQFIFNVVNCVFELYCDQYFMVREMELELPATLMEASTKELICSDWSTLTCEGSVLGDSIRGICYGEKFDGSRHSQGTEVKAITKHDLEVSALDTDVMTICMLIDI